MYNIVINVFGFQIQTVMNHLIKDHAEVMLLSGTMTVQLIHVHSFGMEVVGGIRTAFSLKMNAKTNAYTFKR